MGETVIIIPARMQASRLPGKPLADICGQAMINHVLLRAQESQLGRVIVATDDERIREAVFSAGGEAIMTRADHMSGSDRIYEALQQIDPDEKIEKIINLQGDLPSLDPALIRACAAPLDAADCDIATLGVEIKDESERENPNVVKIVATPVQNSAQDQHNAQNANPAHLRALYFTRATAPYGEGPLYHHIGIYAYKRGALARFVALPPSPLEVREKLEQLRALEAQMRIDVSIVDTVPLGVDTPADLEKARRILAAG